jgi:FK506-binding protein 4/5
MSYNASLCSLYNHSTGDRQEPFRFKLGKGHVIKGWDKGIATMRRGEKCNLLCASE